MVKLDNRLILIGWAQVVVFVLQLLAFSYQAWKLRQTVDAAAAQSADFKNAISQIRRSADETSKVAIASQATAAAAERSANVAERTLADLERPYLLPKLVTIRRAQTLSDDTYIGNHIALEIKNYGRSPATLTNLIIGARIKRPDEEELADEITQPHANVLGDGDDYGPMKWPTKLLRGTRIGDALEKAQFRVKVSLTYEDVAGKLYTRRRGQI